MCDDSQIFSGSLDFGLSDWQHEVVLENLVVDVEGHSVHQLVLEENNWIGVANGSLETIIWLFLASQFKLDDQKSLQQTRWRYQAEIWKLTTQIVLEVLIKFEISLLSLKIKNKDCFPK